LEIEEKDCACPCSCPFNLDLGADWYELEEVKNMKNKDKFVICKWCANYGETCSACGICEKGEYFVPKGEGGDAQKILLK
jgi:phage terminase small subunit